MPAVSNSSPLILFARIGRLELLRDVYGVVIVPTAVWDEVVTGGADRPGAADLPRLPWIRHRVLADQSRAERFLADLGVGEAEALALALELDPSPPLLLDDRKARRIGREHGLSVVGSAGVLLVAKDRGRVAAVGPLLHELRLAGLYLSNAAAARLLALADETPSPTEHA